MNKIFTLLILLITTLAPQLKKANPLHGIKELKEAIKAILEISLLVTKRFKDGVQLEDFTAFWEKFKDDAEFKACIQQGYENYKLVPAEVKDIDWGEGLELAIQPLEYAPKFIDEFKKEENAPSA